MYFNAVCIAVFKAIVRNIDSFINFFGKIHGINSKFFDLIELIVFHLSDFLHFRAKWNFYGTFFFDGFTISNFFLWFWLCSFLRCDILFWFCSFYNNIRLKVKKVPFQKNYKIVLVMVIVSKIKFCFNFCLQILHFFLRQPVDKIVLDQCFRRFHPKFYKVYESGCNK